MKCKFCYKIYKGRNINNVTKHELHCIKNPNFIPYKCDKCNREFNKTHAYIGHFSYCGRIIKKKSRKIENNTCHFCDYTHDNIYKVISHISNCKNNPDFERIRIDRVENGKKSIKHTQETKDKISKSRKEYLRNNPDKVPYLLNHSSKESYPEKYFTEVFKNEGIDVIKSYRIGLYELDFSIPEKKIDIEIDGSQHYLDTKIVESDKRRNDFLKENGWDVIRINWSEYKKLNTEDRIDYISNLKLRLKEYKSIL